MKLTKKRKMQLLLLAGSTFISLIIAEIGLRIYIDNFTPYRNVVEDEKFGWISRPNFKFKGMLVDASGAQYEVDILSDAEGFRLKGDLNSTKPRILVIGDSFTHATHISDDKTYFYLLGNELSAEVFAHGTNAHGNLQEYMILDKYIDQIKPDLVIWQFSSNDIINNSLNLERKSSINQSERPRPYIDSSGIISVIQPSGNAFLRQNIINRSAVLYYSLLAFKKVKSKSASVEKEINKQGSTHLGFIESVATTNQIMGMVRKRVGEKTPIMAFCSSDAQPYLDAFKQISKEYDIAFLEGLDDAMKAEEAAGKFVYLEDKSHWNNHGHKVTADLIGEFIRSNELLKKEVEPKFQ